MPAQGQITFTGDFIPANPAALDVDPDPVILDIGLTDVLVGLFAPGTLDITNGWSLINGDGLLGQSSFSNGVVTIDGPGSAWINRGSLTIGGIGFGTVKLFNGATLQAQTLNIQPTGFLDWVNGTVRITGGSANALKSGNSVFLGTQFGQTRRLELIGGDSTLTGSLLRVGGSGVGSLTIDGGAVSFTNTEIGRFTDGSGIFASATLIDGQWDNTGDLKVGHAGRGIVNIQGGTVTATNSDIGATTGDAGGATITGGRWDSSGDMNIGLLGTGTLDIDGGTVTANNVNLGVAAASSGFATITQGQWGVAGDINVGMAGTGRLFIDGGTVIASNIFTSPIDGATVWTGGTVRIDGGTATGLTDLSGDLFLGQVAGTSQGLQLTNGASFSSNNSVLGSVANTTGVVSVLSGSTWTNAGALNVGQAGTGTLNLIGGTIETQSISVNNGGSFSWNSGTLRIQGGAATGITDSGSDTLTLGKIGAGSTQTLELLGGATFSNSRAALGVFAGATGIVTVDGPGSIWTLTGDLDVGIDSNGVLNITNGGSVSGDAAYLGWRESLAHGEVTIDGPGSSWINSGGVTVGNQGTGILNIRNGATLETTGLIVHPTNGTFNWSDGTIRIKGGGANPVLNASNELRLGTLAGTTQTLELSFGSTLSASRTYVGDAATTAGSLRIDGAGSSVNNTGNVNIGYLGQGDVSISNGGSMTAYNAYVGNAGQGDLVITDGGSMIATRDIFIGFQAGASGEVTVDGPDALLSGRSVFAGYNGAGTLNILNGGTVEAVSFRVFDTLNWANGTLRIKGSNVTGLTVGNNELRLGSNGVSQAATQNLELTQGTRLSVGTANIGKYFQNIGTLTVDGAGSIFGGTTTTLGGQGTGQLIVFNGGAANATTANLNRNGTATITGPGSSWTIATTFNLESGEMQIADGGAVNNNAFVADVATTQGVTARATIDGAGSVWNNNGHLRVGVPGQGLLFIQNGGSVNNAFGYIGYQPSASGKSSVFVTGQDSSWVNRGDLIVARGIGGSLSITDGGSVSNANATIGQDAGADGSVSVSGAGASWISSGEVNVGVAGTGTLSIFNGATVQAQSLFIHPTNGTLNWGNGTIRINGGTATGLVDGSNDLWIGEAQHLELVNGATHSNSRAFIGYGFGQTNPGSGSVRVEGAGSLWNSTGDVFVGIGSRFPSPRGTLTIADGGQVNSKDLRIGNDAGSSGIVTVTGPGSRLNSTGQVYVGRNGGGTLLVQDGGVVEGPYGWLDRGDATIEGPGSAWNITTGGLTMAYFGSGALTIANGGHVSIADDLSIGLLGAPSTLSFTLASLTDPLFDVGGDATLAGTLNVDVDAGLSLADGDSFTLIDIAGTQSGTFANYAQDDLLGTFNGLGLFLDYVGGDGNDVVAYARQAFVAGDMNGDDLLTNGDISAFVLALTDLAGYTSAYPGLDPGPRGDFTGDGALTNGDIAGFVNALVGGSSSVPEPASFLLLGLGGLLVTRRRR